MSLTKSKVHYEPLTLMGLTVRTHNQNEMNPQTSKIGELAGRYWGDQMADQFKERTHPGITYAVYTDFESDEQGEYTYFIGERVGSFDEQDQTQFSSLIIPAGHYQRFTTAAGKMPDIIIAAWQDIWQMSEQDFGGKRRYLADFEIYDERASNPDNAVIDIYIGIQ